MAQALKRLGGGRWESKDGRFTIESQSGTWVLVDNEQMNEFGLPLVRGPFPTLTAAKEAIEDSRTSGPVASPLAEQIERAPKAKEAPKKQEPTEPKWLRDLDDETRRRARLLIKKLERQEIGDADSVARGEFAADQPALARLALERRLADVAAEAGDAQEAVRMVIDLLMDGRDDELGARWKLVDSEGRQIRELDLPS